MSPKRVGQKGTFYTLKTAGGKRVPGWARKNSRLAGDGTTNAPASFHRPVVGSGRKKVVLVRSYTCPHCKTKFIVKKTTAKKNSVITARLVRGGKMHYHIDIPEYKGVENTVTCPNCSRTFPRPLANDKS